MKKKPLLLLRVLGVFLFLGYVGTHLMGANRWVQIKFIRAFDFNRLERVVRYAVERQDFGRVSKWVDYRPQAEIPAMMEVLLPYSVHFPPMMFLRFSARAAQRGDADERNFWVMVAQYRLRFDAMRCGDVEAADAASAQILEAANAFMGETMKDITPAERIRLMHRVLEFDTRYPAVNDPYSTCDMLYRIGDGDAYAMPPSIFSWESIRFNLRRTTDAALARAQEELEREGAEASP